MRISDWSSDVCSSDLLAVAVDGDGGVDVGVLAMDADDHDRHAGLLGDRRFVAAGFLAGGGKLRLHRGELVDAQGVLHLRGEIGRGGLVLAGLHVVEQAGGGRHGVGVAFGGHRRRSEEPTSELQSLMRISYAVFCLKKKNTKSKTQYTRPHSNKK